MIGETTMNRKEYEERLAEKEKEIDKIKAEISALKEKYCNDCSPFKVGDKIRFNGKEGVIIKTSPAWRDFEYHWQPFKKDGSLGCKKIICWYDFEKIEKI